MREWKHGKSFSHISWQKSPPFWSWKHFNHINKLAAKTDMRIAAKHPSFPAGKTVICIFVSM